MVLWRQINFLAVSTKSLFAIFRICRINTIFCRLCSYRCANTFILRWKHRSWFGFSNYPCNVHNDSAGSRLSRARAFGLWPRMGKRPEKWWRGEARRSRREGASLGRSSGGSGPVRPPVLPVKASSVWPAALMCPLGGWGRWRGVGVPAPGSGLAVQINREEALALVTPTPSHTKKEKKKKTHMTFKWSWKLD